MENDQTKERVTVRIEEQSQAVPEQKTADNATHVVFVPPDQRSLRVIYLEGWRDGNSGSYLLYWAVFFLSFALAYLVFMKHATE